MKLDNNNHSVFMLNYHLIMCIKYRNKVIDDIISNRLKEIFEKIAPSYNITLEEWNHDIDNVHILFRGQPNTEISKFINAYKSASSRLIKKEFPQIRNPEFRRQHRDGLRAPGLRSLRLDRQLHHHLRHQHLQPLRAQGPVRQHQV